MSLVWYECVLSSSLSQEPTCVENNNRSSLNLCSFSKFLTQRRQRNASGWNRVLVTGVQSYLANSCRIVTMCFTEKKQQQYFKHQQHQDECKEAAALANCSRFILAPVPNRSAPRLHGHPSYNLILITLDDCILLLFRFLPFYRSFTKADDPFYGPYK